MSHFFTMAIVDHTDHENLEDVLGEIMSPYDENKRVPEYETDCYCVDSLARHEARSKAWDTLKEETGFDLDGMRAKFRDEVETVDMDWEESNKAWQEFTGEWFARRDELEEKYHNEHPMKDKPENDCEDCTGTGRRMTEYNPLSKWDWYQIGGRWAGAFESDYDPSTDPRNIETCWLCGGTGDRAKHRGEDTKGQHPSGCNGCEGKGKSLKWPTQWANDRGNTLPISEMLKADDEEFKENFVPYAIVSRDGWEERGEMGWFGMSSNEKDREEWSEQVRTILEKNKDKLGVVVDCHI